MKKIPFSPPDITEEEIQAVCEVLRSGWITSGPQLAKFEEGIEEYCNVEKALALNSATAAMELVLKFFVIMFILYLCYFKIKYLEIYT